MGTFSIYESYLCSKSKWEWQVECSQSHTDQNNLLTFLLVYLTINFTEFEYFYESSCYVLRPPKSRISAENGARLRLT